MLPGIQLKGDISFAKRRNAVWLSKSKCRITEFLQDKLREHSLPAPFNFSSLYQC
jgi:hypothetical protein